MGGDATASISSHGRFAAMSRRLGLDAIGSLVLAVAVLCRPATSEAGKRRDEGRGLAAGLQRAPYLQSLGRDSVLVVWDADGDGEAAVDFGPNARYDRTVVAITERRNRHVATLRGLQPGAEYVYRVRAGDRVLAEGP